METEMPQHAVLQAFLNEWRGNYPVKQGGNETHPTLLKKYGIKLTLSRAMGAAGCAYIGKPYAVPEVDAEQILKQKDRGEDLCGPRTPTARRKRSGPLPLSPACQSWA